jgi:hypothetical protein
MVVSDDDDKGPSLLGSIIGGNGVGVFGPSIDLGGPDDEIVVGDVLDPVNLFV